VLALVLVERLFSRPIHHFGRVGPRGDVLVYNTARAFNSSLAKGYVQMVDDIRTRGGVAPMVPDVLITAEGTEIYHFDGVPLGDEPYVTLLHVTPLHSTYVTLLHERHSTPHRITCRHTAPCDTSLRCYTPRHTTPRLGPHSDSGKRKKI
jgi:hypothetical protein